MLGLIMKRTGFHIPGVENLFLVVEYCFISFYYIRLFGVRSFYAIISLLLLVLFFTHTIFARNNDWSSAEHIFRVNLLAGSLFYLWYMISAMAGFYKLIRHPKEDFIEHSDFFWVNVAFLIYASGVFFIFLYAEIIEAQNYKMISLLWNYLFCSLNIIKNIFLAKALSVENGSVKR